MGLDPLLGEIQLFAGTFAPQGWALCDGSLVPIASNAALFSIIGTRFGGDGKTTFALPDLRGRIPIGTGQGPGLTPRNIGDDGGVESVPLTIVEMPAHTHVGSVQPNVQINASTMQGSVAAVAEGVIIGAGYDIEFQATIDNFVAAGSSSTEQLGGPQLSIEATLQGTGSNAAHENMMPFLAMNYIIAVQGVFPQRP